MWNNIVKIDEDLKISNFSITDSIEGVMGDGTQTLFWIDKWVVRDLLKIHLTCGVDKIKQKALQAIIQTTCWCILKARNEVIFYNKRASVNRIKEDIKRLSFFWVKIEGNL